MEVACVVNATTSGRGAPFVLPDTLELQRAFPELEIEALLGRGGMGVVYRVRQTKLDRQAALKILAPHRADDPVLAERFLREARTLARLSHPHIVSIFDMGRAGDFWFILMEYVDGASLRGLMGDGALSADEAVRLVPQICDAMQYAHDQGVVHRDIKPENVLVDQNGQVKIADFGIAKLAGDPHVDDVTLTSVGARMGTSGYMAPEQASNTADVDHRADIYSLGIMFYEMLTGKLPTPDYTPPSRLSEVDARLDRVVERSLRDAPQDRFQQAAHLKQALESIASSNAAGARLRFAALALILGVAACVGFVGWSHYRAGRATPAGAAHAQPAASAKPRESPQPLQSPFTAVDAQSAQAAWAERLQSPVELRDSAGIALRLIPPGVFELQPEYVVAVTRPFYLGRTEITVEQFRQFVAETGYVTEAESSGLGGFVHLSSESADAERRPEYVWHHVRFSTGDDRPVGQVTVVDMERFCQWLSRKEGCLYRLPTEAEWNWAARAGIATTKIHPEPWDDSGLFGWFGGVAENRSHAVAGKLPNAWGLFDMFGNMCEMCQDGWDDDFPQGRFENPQRPARQGRRPGMGSSFADPPWAVRHNLNDALPFHSVGFRVVRETP